MMIRCCLFLIALGGIFLEASAQQEPDLDPQKAIPYADFLRILVEPPEVEKRVYLFKDWQQGEVFLQGRFASGITFKYDVLNHALLVQVDEKELLLNPIAIDSMLLANSSRVLINPIILEGVDSDRLLLRVYGGTHLSLFRKMVANVMEEAAKTTSTTELIYAEKDDIQIDQQQTYFLLNKATHEVSELQGKKKELKKWENGDQVLDFVKKQNLNLGNEAALIQVVQYYEQLTFVGH